MAKADVTTNVYIKSPLSHVILKERGYYTDGLIQSAGFININLPACIPILPHMYLLIHMATAQTYIV